MTVKCENFKKKVVLKKLVSSFGNQINYKITVRYENMDDKKLFLHSSKSDMNWHPIGITQIGNTDKKLVNLYTWHYNEL